VCPARWGGAPEPRAAPACGAAEHPTRTATSNRTVRTSRRQRGSRCIGAMVLGDAALNLKVDATGSRSRRR